MIVLTLACAGEPLVRFGHRLQCLCGGKAGRTVSGQHNVRGLVHYRTGGDDRVLITLQGGNRTGLAGFAVHDAGIQFVVAVQIGRGPATGNIKAAVFQHHHGFDGHIKGAGTGVQTGLHGLYDLAHMYDLQIVVALAACACAAVKNKCRTTHRMLLKQRYPSRQRPMRCFSVALVSGVYRQGMSERSINARCFVQGGRWP